MTVSRPSFLVGRRHILMLLGQISDVFLVLLVLVNMEGFNN